MRRLIIIITILLLTKSIVLSQTLSGAILPDYKLDDSTYVYSAAKVKAILQLSVNLNLYSKLLNSAESEVGLLRTSISNGYLAVNKLSSSNLNLLLRVKYKDEQIVTLSHTITLANKEIKRIKFKNTLLQIGLGTAVVGGGILAGFLIEKTLTK